MKPKEFESYSKADFGLRRSIVLFFVTDLLGKICLLGQIQDM